MTSSPITIININMTKNSILVFKYGFVLLRRDFFCTCSLHENVSLWQHALRGGKLKLLSEFGSCNLRRKSLFPSNGILASEQFFILPIDAIKHNLANIKKTFLPAPVPSKIFLMSLSYDVDGKSVFMMKCSQKSNQCNAECSTMLLRVALQLTYHRQFPRNLQSHCGHCCMLCLILNGYTRPLFGWNFPPCRKISNQNVFDVHQS